MVELLKVGKEYQNGRGRTFKILQKTKTGRGQTVFLGVSESAESYVGFVTGYYLGDGKSLGGGSEEDNLKVFDYMSLKLDDVILIDSPHPGEKKTYYRHVCRVERDAVYIYCDGVSSLTREPTHNGILKISPSLVIKKVTKSSV